MARPSARRPARKRPSHRGVWLLLAAVVALAIFSYSQRGPLLARYRRLRAAFASYTGSSPAAPAPTLATNPVTAPAVSPAPACGSGRLPVKDLYDRDATAVTGSPAKDTTLGNLLHFPRPVGVDAADAVRTPAEHSVVRVPARLVSFHLDAAQNLVLTLEAMAGSERITAVLPAGSCTSSQDSADLFNELREDIGLRFGTPAVAPTVLTQPVAVTVKGVVYFGSPGGAGAALNGVELHPVLDFTVQ